MSRRTFRSLVVVIILLLGVAAGIVLTRRGAVISADIRTNPRLMTAVQKAASDFQSTSPNRYLAGAALQSNQKLRDGVPDCDFVRMAFRYSLFHPGGDPRPSMVYLMLAVRRTDGDSFAISTFQEPLEWLPQFLVWEHFRLENSEDGEAISIAVKELSSRVHRFVPPLKFRAIGPNRWILGLEGFKKQDVEYRLDTDSDGKIRHCLPLVDLKAN